MPFRDNTGPYLIPEPRRPSQVVLIPGESQAEYAPFRELWMVECHAGEDPFEYPRTDLDFEPPTSRRINTLCGEKPVIQRRGLEPYYVPPVGQAPKSFANLLTANVSCFLLALPEMRTRSPTFSCPVSPVNAYVLFFPSVLSESPLPLFSVHPVMEDLCITKYVMTTTMPAAAAIPPYTAAFSPEVVGLALIAVCPFASGTCIRNNSTHNIGARKRNHLTLVTDASWRSVSAYGRPVNCPSDWVSNGSASGI